jgi:hypothetical protein
MSDVISQSQFDGQHLSVGTHNMKLGENIPKGAE